MNLQDLVESLPKKADPISPSTESPEFKLVSESRRDFVVPNLASVVKDSEARATLVTAPAAAGKSTCAEFLSAHTGALYVDLSHKRVADGSFLGLIEEALGEDDGLAFRKELRAGGATIVFDALDEANVAVGDAAFVSFIRGMCRFLRTSIGPANVVLMSRSDTATWVRSTFADENVQLNEYEIDYFHEAQADDFLDLKLDGLYDGRGRPRAHRIHRAPYIEAKSNVFERLGLIMGFTSVKSAWSDQETRRFLGYSPVLEGIGSYLCVDDFRTLDSLPESAPDAVGSEWSFLIELIRRLLEREQGKFQDAWLDELTRPFFQESGLQAIYGLEEQADRLFSLVNLGQFRIDRADLVPEALQNSFSQAVETQLGNHPFLSTASKFVSPLFSDFVSAVCLLDPETRQLDRKISFLRSQNRSSAALGPFLLALSSRGVATDLLDLVVSSLRSRDDRKGGPRRIDIDVSGDSGHLSIASSENPAETFALSPRGQVNLPSSIEFLDVQSSLGVDILGSSIRLGPEVRITAEMISSAARECRVEAHEHVVLESPMIVFDWAQVVEVLGEHLAIRAGEAEGWPSRFAENLPDPTGDTTHETRKALRRLIRFFRRTQHTPAGMLSADAGQIRTYVLRTDETASGVVELLERSDYFLDAGPELRLRQSFFADMRLNYTDVLAMRTSAELEALLGQVRDLT